jgi:hypothetical protein
MTTLEVKLSDTTFQFLAEQAQAQGFESASAYLAALAIEAEATRDAVEQELIQGVKSGEPRDMTRADWDELKRRVWERHEAEHGP